MLKHDILKDKNFLKLNHIDTTCIHKFLVICCLREITFPKIRSQYLCIREIVHGVVQKNPSSQSQFETKLHNSQNAERFDQHILLMVLCFSKLYGHFMACTLIYLTQRGLFMSHFLLPYFTTKLACRSNNLSCAIPFFSHRLVPKPGLKKNNPSWA